MLLRRGLPTRLWLGGGASLRLRPCRLLTAVLTALAGHVRVEIVFVAVKGVWAVVYARLRRPSLVLSRIAVLEAHVIVGSGIRPVWLRVIRLRRSSLVLSWIGVPEAHVIVGSGIGPVWLRVIRLRRPSLVLSRIAVLEAHVIVGSGIRPVWLRVIRRTVVSNIVGGVVAAAVLIDPRIAAVDVPVDDFVVYAGTILSWGAAALTAIVSKVPSPVAAGTAVPFDAHIVFLNVVIVHVPVDRIIAVDVVDVHRAIDDRSIDIDIGVAVVDVDVVPDIDAFAAAPDPAAVPTTTTPAFTPPSGVIDAAPTAAVAPAEIQVQPCTDGIANAKGYRRTPVRTTIVNDRGVVDRDVDVLRLVWSNRDVVAVLQNLFLWR